MAPAESMPLRNRQPESHVIRAAEPAASTLDILKAARPPAPPVDNPLQADKSSFIEDVELWVRKYLNLADEVLQAPAEPGIVNKKSA